VFSRDERKSRFIEPTTVVFRSITIIFACSRPVDVPSIEPNESSKLCPCAGCAG
jgi:hypothetical protein